MKQKYRAKEIGSDTFIYGHGYIAYNNHCFIHNLTVQEHIPIDECSLEQLIDNKWVKVQIKRVEIG